MHTFSIKQLVEFNLVVNDSDVLCDNFWRTSNVAFPNSISEYDVF